MFLLHYSIENSMLQVQLGVSVRRIRLRVHRSLHLVRLWCVVLGRVRSSPLKQSPGYQVDLVIQLVWVSGEPPQQITSLAVNSSYGL